MRLSTAGLVCLIAMMVAACSHAPAEKTSAATPKSARHNQADRQARVPNEYLVTLVPEAKESAISDLFGRFGIKDLHALGGDTWLLILTNDPGPGEMLDLVERDPRFERVQPNLIYWANRSSKKAK
jgi:hypothetical protein